MAPHSSYNLILHNQSSVPNIGSIIFNYLLLSEIMDKVLGYPHFEFIQEEILNRLNIKNTFQSVNDVDINDVMSGYHVGYPLDLRTDNRGMLASAEDVGIFLRALNDGTLFDEGEQEIYSSIYEYEHTGWVPGYYSIARYHEDIDTVIIQFVSTTGGETWGFSNVIGGKITGISNIIYNRIVRILNNE